VGIWRGVSTRKPSRNSPVLTAADATRLARVKARLWLTRTASEASAVVAIRQTQREDQ
jgi:hypothetical protein